MLLSLACSQHPTALEPVDRGASAPGSPSDVLGEGGLPRRETLGAFLDAHWRLPIAPQGAPPPGWSPVEASLDPAACGSCHPKQLAEWRGSLHAGAYSPGFAGQLIEGRLARARALRRCQTCHAPLAEQQPLLRDGTPSPHFDATLRAQGIVCVSCHVRGHRRFGPSRKTMAPGPNGTDTTRARATSPHGGFEVRDEFGQSRFCARCHQFFGDPGPAGKPVENTFVEWRVSPQAAAGETCQSCHMPGRAHTWLGIHDAEMVRAAVATRFGITGAPAGRVAAELTLTNTGVGHRLPTYVTPRLFLSIVQTDPDGNRITASEETLEIGRKIDFATDSEVFDTRIAPGRSAVLRYSRPRARGAAALAARITVDPDFHYRGVFRSLLQRLEHPEARSLISEALRRSSESSYVLYESSEPLPLVRE